MTSDLSFEHSSADPVSRQSWWSENEGGDWALFGSTGVTGRMILTRALSRGYRPELIGRSSKALSALAAMHELRHRFVDLDDEADLRSTLSGARLVLNAAGPFYKTSAPLVRAAIATGCDYLDLSGEIADLRRLLACDDEARAAGVALVGGCGFGVAATDGLAALVSARLGGAERLRISVAVESAFSSPAVVESTLAVLAGGGLEVRNGGFVPAPIAGRRWRATTDDQKPGRHFAAAPLAELAAAFHATGVGDIVAGVPMPPVQARLLAVLSPILPRLLRFAPVRAALANTGGHSGLGAERQFRSTALVEGWRGDEEQHAQLIAGEGFDIAASIAVASIAWALARRVAPGAHTPATAFGPDFIRNVRGLEVTTSW